jgi:two-component system NarL family sensor kinase
LRQYVEGFGSRSGLNCGLKMRATGERLPARLQRSVFRIVQEGLANAYRRASASKVTVAVRRIGPQLHVIISDDGRGMDEGRQRLQSPPGRPGVGIRGIRMRLSQMNGRLRITRPPSGGTRLHAVLPITYFLAEQATEDQKSGAPRRYSPQPRSRMRPGQDFEPQP